MKNETINNLLICTKAIAFGATIASVALSSFEIGKQSQEPVSAHVQYESKDSTNYLVIETSNGLKIPLVEMTPDSLHQSTWYKSERQIEQDKIEHIKIEREKMSKEYDLNAKRYDSTIDSLTRSLKR